MKKSIDDKRKYFTVKISVDEETLIEERGESNNGEPFDIEEAISNEFGWLEDSGICIESIEPAK